MLAGLEAATQAAVMSLSFETSLRFVVELVVPDFGLNVKAPAQRARYAY